jgi:hypothetical protein
MSESLKCPYKEALAAEQAKKQLNFSLCMQSCAWWDAANNACCVVSATRAIIGIYAKLGSSDNR